MKDKILKLISVTIILCMLITMLIPNFVKSATVVVSNMTNTGRGIGNTSIFTVKINGYSNLYCVRGGAEIRTGWQLNDGGVSLYTTTGAVVTNSSAMQWLLDNMYLTEGADSNTQKAMRQNLINIMKKYNTYKDSNGNSLLNKKLNGNGINDEWITKAVDDVINDKTTLFAVQQYAIWNHVKNTYTSYYNTMQNSDGSYNAIPGAKASRVHYTALYITLNELAAEAQKNGYKSPNNSGRGFDIKIEKQSNTKATISSDGKSVLAGPYKLKNNHGLVTKSFSATINSDKADKVETVNAEGKGVSVSESQGEFYVKVTYNKGFAKGTEYKIGINVGLSGYRTFATLLDTPNAYHQPLVTIRKEAVNTSTKTDITVKEELKGDYSLILEKISSEGEKISGVTFKVKEGSGEAKTYGPTDSNGEVKVVTNKKIEKEGIDEYTITEVNVGKNKLVKVQDEIKLYVTKANVNGKYVASKVSFEKDKEVKEKVVKLEDGTNATVTASVSGNTVKLIIPNKPEDEPKEFDMALRKYISEVKRDGKTVEIADRTPVINASSASEYLKNKTAGYYHTKNPITVKPGDTVIYTLRVYNEGYIDGYAKEITDYLPAGLEYIEDSQINKDNGWTITKNEDGTATVKTDKLKGELIPPANGGQGFLSYYADIQVGKDVKEPSFSKEVTIECKVKEDMQDNKLLVNVAEITNYGYNDEQGNYIEAGKDGVDIDSEENNVFRKKDNIKNIDEYYENNVKPQDKENKDNYKGEQDDDDFERILVEPNDTPPGTPEIHKGVKDILNQDSGYNGDEEHDWVIQTSIPTGINKFKKYIVTDTIHENLVFDEEKGIEKVVVKIGDKQLEKDKDYQVTYNKETRELKISFIEGDFIAGQSLKEGSIIEIRFKTTFAKDEQGNIKALNQEIPNQATLIYDNGSGKEEEKKSEEPEVHTGAVAVYKYNEETKVALEGAKFKIATSKENAEKGIFVKDVNGKDIEEISNDKGIATFTGLEFGGDANASEENKKSDGTYSYDFENAKKTYYIVETEAPEGFNKYEGVIEVEVSKNTTLTEIKNMKSVANTPITPPGTPEIHKGVKDILNQDSGYNGDEEHDWVIQTSIPTGINKFKKYIVTDTIHENLVFDEEKGIEKVVVKIGDKQLEKDKDYQVTYNKETRELKISFIEGDFIAGQSLKEGSIIEIRFKTTFAKDEQGNIKALNQEIPNQATLIYDNGSGKEEEKKSEEPEVHTGAVAVYKYNEETKVALEGAKFKIATSKENAEKGIFVKDVNGKDIEEISNDKGIATFTGLEFGGDANASEENKKSDGTYSYDFENAKKTYYIVETEAPEGFNKYEGVIEVEVSKNTTLTEIKNMKSVANTPKGEFDLALRKYITKVISKDSSENVVELENRIPNPNVDSLKDKTSTTASYIHSKNPVIVKVGDTIIYTLRVYNEGDIAGYAQEIVDHLPEGLEFVNDEFNSKYGWIIDENDKSLRTIRTTYLSKQRNEKENIISAFNKNTGELSYKDIQVKCKVKDSVSESQKLTNIAEITKYIGKDGEETIDRDSKEEVKLPNDEELPNYKDDEISKEYVPGQEDDDDFEKVIIESTPPEIHKGIKDILNQNSGYNGDEEHDWVIRTSIPAGINKFKKYIVTDTIHENLVFDEEKGIEKVVVKIGDKQLEKDKDYQVTYNKETRELKISFIEGDFIAGQSLKEGSIIEIRFKTTFAKDEQGNIKALNQEIPNQATLIYDNGSGKEEEKKSEEPEVHTGAVAVYKYNEETKVALEGAKFKIATSKENAEKGIFVKDVNGKDIEEISNDKGIATFTGLEFGGDANASEENKKSDGTYSYDFENAKKTYYIVETEAPEGFNKYEGVIEVEVSKNTTLTEIKNMKSIANSPEEKDFDLALRKFITGVNDKEVTSRIPVFKIDEKGNYVYNHDKEPVLVANSNIVTYTLRVYNEGEVAGYAKEIKDNIPEGLEFMPDNELNKEYRWIMLDKYGKETDNVADSKYITTDYLSKEQEKTAGSNLLKPFDEKAYEAGSIKEPDYKEVKVAFKVNMPDKSEEIIINKAEISDEVDENGNKVTDKDSTPNEWIDGEDDQDIEKIKIQYFDLALRKWVTKAIVTENGIETVHETGHKAEDDPEAVVKVDLKKSDINKVTVKFEYKIRIENQGKIAGYAKEISDYIPEGLKFVKEDNPLWEEVEGKVVTDQLKDTLLGPGETAEVSILLTWINREDNMGLKVNVAEISKDYNEYGAKDIDSTPNNKVTGEDDIDDATVLLSVTTGEGPVYVILTISILTILAGGIFTIKRYVLD